MTLQFVNIVRFAEALHFRHRALGLRRRIIVGSTKGWLCLPCGNPEAIGVPFSTLKPPRVRDIAYAVRVYNHGLEPIEQLRWGGYFAWNQNMPEQSAVASVDYAAMVFSERQAVGLNSLAQVTEQCGNHLNPWYLRLIDWIEVLIKADLDATQPLQAGLGWPRLSTAPWISTRKGHRGYNYVDLPHYAIASDGEKALDEKLWTAAVRGANKVLRPSEERLLLRDARAALARRNFRRAVLDAATAVELIIEPVLRRALLRTNTTGFVDDLLNSAWQFVRRRKLMAQLGLWLPPKLDTSLMKVRNRVIHQNAVVTPMEVRAAVEVAEEVVDRYAPLKLP